MESESDRKVVLGLIGGAPAAGKSYLLHNLVNSDLVRKADIRVHCETFHLDTEFRHLCDETHTLYETSDDLGDHTRSLWHMAREKLYRKVETRLSILQKEGIEGDKGVIDIDGENTAVALLVEDNFHYPSMRKPYFHLALANEIGYLAVMIQCPIALAKERNQNRCGSQQVTEASQERISEVIESQSAVSWEKGRFMAIGAPIHEEQQEKLILELQHAWSQPLKKDTENRDEYWKERLKTAENIVHQTDIALRKKISELMRIATSLGRQEKKQVAEILAHIKHDCLSYVKECKSINDIENGIEVATTKFNIMANDKLKEWNMKT